MAAHQAPPSLGFSRQEHWSGLLFPSPVHESEKWKGSHQLCLTPSDPMDCSPPGSSVHRILQARVLEWGAIAQLCLTLCNPMHCSLPGSSVHRILQTRILEWVVMSSSRVSSRPRDWTCIFYVYLHWQVDSLPLVPPRKPMYRCYIKMETEREHTVISLLRQ